MRFGIRIPSSGAKAIKRMLTMKKDEFDSLVQGVKKIPDVFVSRTEFDSILIPLVPSLDAEFVGEIASALVSLYEIREETGQTEEDFQSEIIRNLKEEKNFEDLNIDDPQIQSRLKEFLSIEKLQKWVVAENHLTNHQRVYTGGQIITDIRPVFSGKEITGSVIVHQLKIEFTEDEEGKEFFVALDADDVLSLAGVLKEATERENSLCNGLKTLGWTYYSPLGSNKRQK
jgi:hypothetical protein